MRIDLDENVQRHIIGYAKSNGMSVKKAVNHILKSILTERGAQTPDQVEQREDKWNNKNT